MRKKRRPYIGRRAFVTLCFGGEALNGLLKLVSRQRRPLRQFFTRARERRADFHMNRRSPSPQYAYCFFKSAFHVPPGSV